MPGHSRDLVTVSLNTPVSVYKDHLHMPSGVTNLMHYLVLLTKMPPLHGLLLIQMPWDRQVTHLKTLGSYLSRRICHLKTRICTDFWYLAKRVLSNSMLIHNYFYVGLILIHGGILLGDFIGIPHLSFVGFFPRGQVLLCCQGWPQVCGLKPSSCLSLHSRWGYSALCCTCWRPGVSRGCLSRISGTKSFKLYF